MRAPATGSVTADKFVGRQMRAQITHEDYEGRPQARVGEMYPLTQVGGPTKPSPAAVVINKTPAATTPVTKKVVAKKAGLPKDATEEKDIPF
jgi:hypothetical protein